MGNVLAPAGGLSGNSNYILNSNCAAVTDLVITIAITEDIYVPLGMSFQLNAYSAQNTNCVYQQYGFYFFVQGHQIPSINWLIDLWPSDSYRSALNLPSGHDLINQHPQLHTMSSAAPVLPAGYTLTLKLSNDTEGRVTAVSYSANDGAGHSYNYGPVTLVGLPIDGSPTHAKLDSGGIAPIHAFELNIVGQDDGYATLLQSGAGTITYAASSPLTVANILPNCVSAAGSVTAETSNASYAGMPAGPSHSATQAFTAPPAQILPGAYLAASQRFGAGSQTELYVVGPDGQLKVFEVTGTGAWSGPIGYGPTALAHSGVPLAACEQFGGGGQTDVFTVANNGQLQVYWAKASGGFSGPVPISATGFAPASAHIAACQEFALADKTDAFVVNKAGQISVFSVESLGNWSGPELIGPAYFAPPGAGVVAGQQFGCLHQTNVWVVDNTGRLVVFWSEQPGQWKGPVPLSSPGFAPPGADLATCQQFGCNNQTNIWVLDNTGRLVVFWVENNGEWNGPVALSAPGLAPPGAAVTAIQQFGCLNQTDAIVVDNTGLLNLFWAENNGSWNGPVTIGFPGFTPPGSKIAASQQFGGNNQTDLFCVSNAGWTNCAFVQSNGAWGGPEAI